MNLKIVLKLFFNYKITQTLKTKPHPQITWIQMPQTFFCNSHLSGSGFFSAVTFLSACTLCQMLSRPLLSNTFSYVPCGTPRLRFLQICDILTLAITPNAMVPTVIQKIGMKLLITTEAVSLLPFSDQSHFSDSKCPGVTSDPTYIVSISVSPAPLCLEFLSTHWPWELSRYCCAHTPG